MKILCISSKPIKFVICIVLSFVLLVSMIALTNSHSIYFGHAQRKVPIYSVETKSRKIAITFDAAWGGDKTSEIVKICKDKGIPATFFLVGFWTEKFPELVKLIDNAGFDIGTHSNTHPNMSGLSDSQMRNELSTSMKLITDITGKAVRFFRPPYGDYNDRLLSISSELHLQTIQWSVDSLDWKGLSASQLLSRITDGVHNGAIILCHNNSDHIVEALPQIIDALKARGYEFSKMSELVYDNNYTIDNNGMQKQNLK
ncbi:MAG: polysaccharide deacetylase family protein [Clostridia bacterium]